MPLSRYHNKKVLVTGSTGFKGSWLTLCLQYLGAHVTGYALDPPGKPNLFSAIALEETGEHIRGDVRDADHLARTVKELAPECIFHLAAQPQVRRSYTDPPGTYATNVMGTVNLLEAVRTCSAVRGVVIVTGHNCYENNGEFWGYRESDPLGGHDPYSSAKACAELVVSAFSRSFFSAASYGKNHEVAIATARAGNVIAGGDWGEDRLLPDCMRAFAENEPVIIRNPHAVRPWQHVLDPLYGYLLLGAQLMTQGPAFAGAWNFGPASTVSYTVRDIVNHCCSLWGQAYCSIAAQEKNPHEAQTILLDSSKAHHLLKWHPRINLEDALALTVPWYLRYYSGESSQELLHAIQERIAAYLEN